MSLLMVGIYALLAVVAVGVGAFLYLLVKSTFRTGQIEELEKEIQRIRTSLASPSALLIADLVNEESRLLFDVSMNNEKITGLAFKRGFWSGEGRGGGRLASLKIWRKPKKVFESVEYTFDGAKNPNSYLWSNSKVKLLGAEMEDRGDGIAVQPLLMPKDLEKIRNAKDLLRTIADTVSQMGKQNYEFFKQVVTKWKQVDFAFKGGLGEVATFIGRVARHNDKLLGKLAKGWNLEEGGRAKFKQKMNVKKFGKMLTDISPDKEELSIKELKQAINETLEKQGSKEKSFLKKGK